MSEGISHSARWLSVDILVLPCRLMEVGISKDDVLGSGDVVEGGIKCKGICKPTLEE